MYPFFWRNTLLMCVPTSMLSRNVVCLLIVCKTNKLAHWWWMLTLKHLYNGVILQNDHRRIWTNISWHIKWFVFKMSFKKHTYLLHHHVVNVVDWLNLIHICKDINNITMHFILHIPLKFINLSKSKTCWNKTFF